MVILQPRGGMSNQLFQYAFARNLAHKMNTELKIDTTYCDSQKDFHHTYYQLSAFNIHEVFATPEELKSVNERDWRILKAINDIARPINYSDNVFVEGGNWFYHENFFAEIESIIRREITLRNALHETSARWKEKITSAKCAVSAHVRIGDYLLPSCRTWGGYILPPEYFIACTNYLKKIYPDITIFVFSDDLDWCRENLKFDVPVQFVEGCEKDYEELYLMSLCKHNICSISTFSWWGAWLNQNPDKKVFAPHFGIALQNSIRIPVDVNKCLHNKFPVMLSIVLHVSDDISTVATVMSAVANQDFKEYELIIVDSSTDGSGKFCRQFAANENVSIIKSPKHATKYTAWNIGLDCAQGDYVLFLTGKDIILSETVKSLAKTLGTIFLLHSKKTHKYISMATYYENYCAQNPNIICAVQRIEEVDKGRLVINGLANKRFESFVDEPFQNLKEDTEIELDTRRELFRIVTGQMNNLLGTKFFKRAFLNENKIRFDENLKGGGTELMFLINAFMHTDKIVVVPQIFYGRFN